MAKKKPKLSSQIFNFFFSFLRRLSRKYDSDSNESENDDNRKKDKKK